jgi:hypothetical protein
VIQYTLSCDNAHRFDAWFGSAAAFEDQQQRGIVTCPVCLSTTVAKAPMAPAVNRAGSEKVSLSAGHPDRAKLRQAMIALREKVMKEADYVGDRFAEEARKIHFDEADPRGIYGEATREEVAGLIEDGIDFLPLPQVPDEAN